MLDRLRIVNYQCHQKIDIKLDPQITAIVGASDVRKSAILRAIKWLATNRPLGTSFIRDGSDSTKVKMRVDGKDIERKRGKSENSYKVDGKVYEAFGTDVPPAATELLNLGEENFSGQHDAPFWFSLSSGEVAQRLNRIVDLAVIDQVMSTIAGWLRKAKAEVEVTRERLSGATARLAELDYVPSLDDDLSGLEQSRRSWTEKTVEGNRLTSMLGDIKDAESKVVEVPDLSGLEGQRREMIDAVGKFEKVKSIGERIDNASSLVADRRFDLAEAEDRFIKEVGETCPLCGNRMSPAAL